MTAATISLIISVMRALLSTIEDLRHGKIDDDEAQRRLTAFVAALAANDAAADARKVPTR